MTALDFHAQDLIQLKRVSSVTPSPDGTWLAVVTQRLNREHKSKYIQDIWRIPSDGIGPKVRLTTGESQDHHPGFDHHQMFLFLSNRPHHNEDSPKTQLWCFPPHGGDARRLTNEPLGISDYMHAEDDDLFVVVTDMLPGVAHDDQAQTAKKEAEHGPSALLYSKMPVRFWDHWLPKTERHYIVYRDAERLDLTPDCGQMFNRASHTLSPNGRWLAIAHSVDAPDYSPRTSKLTLIDTHTGEHHEILDPGRAWIFNICFSNDSSVLAYTKQEVDPSQYGEAVVHTYNLNTKTHRAHPYSDDLSFSPVAFGASNDVLYGSADCDGQTPIYALSLTEEDNTEVTLTRLTSAEQGGSFNSIVRDPTSDRLFGVFSSFVQPPEAFALTPGDDRASLPSPLNRLKFNTDDISVEYLSATSTDGTECPYYVLKPANHDDAAPAIMWIHGGPIGQWGDIWHWRWNALTGLSKGYVMVLPNPKGSTGLGQAHIEGIWGNTWGGQCYDDLMAVTDAVAVRDDVKEEYMVAMGGSFGGYMTNWIGTQTDRFCCLVSHAGIVNMRTFHGVTDSPVWWSHLMNVNPFKDPSPMDKYSPMTHIGEWKSPTLVIHGQQDYRVPVGEALILFDALQAHDVESQLLIYPDENHWILKPNNILSWYEHVYRFISQYANELKEHDDSAS